MKNKKIKFRKGFTLVELLLVLVVIAVLAGAFMLSGEESVISAEANNIISNMRIIKTAALEWIAEHGDYIDPFDYFVTYPLTYLEASKLSGYPKKDEYVIHKILTHAAWRNSLTNLDPKFFGTISFHEKTDEKFANKNGYSIIDNSAEDKDKHNKWYVVYCLKSADDDKRALKIREKLASSAKGLLKNKKDYYTLDANFIYMEIVDFDEYYGKK